MADSDASAPEGMSEDLRIGFVRSGGFGGLRLAAELDGAELTPGEAALVRSLLEGQDPPPATATAQGADRFRYELTIRGGGASRSMSLSETDLTPELRPLVHRLEAHARRRG